MIQVDDREIRFTPERVDEEHPPARSFPLLSGYVCPFCRKILAAYFQGTMSQADIAYHQRQKPHYRIGSVAGGHYIKQENHYGYYGGADRCPWEEFSGRGVVENLRLFVQRHDLPRMLILPLSEKIGSIPGLCLVEDVCGRDREMLLFSEDRLFGDLREKKGFDAYWKTRDKLGEYLMELVRQ